MKMQDSFADFSHFYDVRRTGVYRSVIAGERGIGEAICWRGAIGHRTMAISVAGIDGGGGGRDREIEGCSKIFGVRFKKGSNIPKNAIIELHQKDTLLSMQMYF